MSNDRQAELDGQLADDLANFYDDPLGYVMYAFPWDTDLSIQVVDWESEEIFVDPKTGICYDAKPNSVATITYAEWMEPYRERFNCRYGPDAWACKYLDQIGQEVRKRKFTGRKAVDPIRMTTASGHGIGKSTLTAWLISWIMDTRPNCKGTVTANTAEQLRTKTWAELGKWHKKNITSHLYKYSNSRGNMNYARIGKEEDWFCSAFTCREENSESFAGQHAAASTSFYIFDEASAVPPKIYTVREGGTVTGEPMVFDFGNPTRNTGQFYENTEGRMKHRHIVRKIDSRCVAITNKKRIQEWIDDYGIDSDFVKVRVLGEFPSAGTLQFIRTDWVTRAMGRELPPPDRYAPVRIGVDVARFGDDHSVIYPVLGVDARTYAPTQNNGIWSGLDTHQLAFKVMEKIDFFRSLGIADVYCAVDVTGLGAGVVDTCRGHGYEVEEVNFGTSPVREPEKYRLRVDELWGHMRDEIESKLVLPEQPTLVGIEDAEFNSSSRNTAGRLFADLTQREFGYTLVGEKIQLESKRDMKNRGVASPDIADGLSLATSIHAARSTVPRGSASTSNIPQHDFDPLANASVG